MARFIGPSVGAFLYFRTTKQKGKTMIEVLNGVTWRLVDENHEPVSVGQDLVDFRGDSAVLDNAQCPRHDGSTGRANGFFPSVFNLKWVKEGL